MEDREPFPGLTSHDEYSLNEERYRQLIEHLHCGLVVHAPDTKIVLCNQEASRLLGLSREQMEGKEAVDPAWCFVDELGLPLPVSRYPVMQVLTSGLPLKDFLGGVVRPETGERAWMLVNAFPEFDARNALRHIVVTFVDVTERKNARARQEAHSQAMTMISSGAPLAAVLDSVVRGVEAQHPKMLCSVLLLDPSGRFLDLGAAPSLPRFYNDAVRGMEIGPERGSCGAAAFSGQRVITENLRTSPSWEPAWELVERAGLGSCWSEPIKSSTGRVLGTFAIYYSEPRVPDQEGIATIVEAAKLASVAIERSQDEAHRARLQAQLLQSQKLESIGRLAGGVAHDFNNMLVVMLGYLDLAMNQIDPASPTHGHLRQVREAAQSSAELTRQLLTYARKQPIKPKLLDLNTVIPGTLKMLHRLIGESIQIEWGPSAESGLVKMDPSQVDQILTNLTINARDAIGCPGGRITISTSAVTLDLADCQRNPAARPGEYVVLRVGDNGRGMDSETLEHLFEPFYTTKELGKGTGLGCAIVYGIVEQNGGFLGVESALERGTTFTMYFPRVRGVSEADQRGGSDPNSPSVVPSLKRRTETLLLVEDERAILDLVKAALESEGYSVLAARSPASALHAAQHHDGPIHALITDVVMPESNGRELSSRVAALRPGIRVIFMSGYIPEVFVRNGEPVHERYVLQKPFAMPALLEKVRGVLDE